MVTRIVWELHMCCGLWPGWNENISQKIEKKQDPDLIRCFCNVRLRMFLYWDSIEGQEYMQYGCLFGFSEAHWTSRLVSSTSERQDRAADVTDEQTRYFCASKNMMWSPRDWRSQETWKLWQFRVDANCRGSKIVQKQEFALIYLCQRSQDANIWLNLTRDLQLQSNKPHNPYQRNRRWFFSRILLDQFLLIFVKSDYYIVHCGDWIDLEIDVITSMCCTSTWFRWSTYRIKTNTP